MTPNRIPEPIPDAEPDFGSGPAPGYKPPYPPEYAPEDTPEDEPQSGETTEKPGGLPAPPHRPEEDPPVPPVPPRDPGDRPPPPRPGEDPPLPPPDPKPGDAVRSAQGRDEPPVPLPPAFHIPPGHRPLTDFTRIVRSKNRSPFELSLDVICRSERDYNALHNSGAFTAHTLAVAYDIPDDDVLDLVWYRPALAVKAVLRRAVSSGAPGDTDVYGVQQHGPLLRMMIPV